MASKLKNLAVTKVDFVDQGANPDAHIRLFKRRGTQEDAGKEGFWKRFFQVLAKKVGMEDDEISHFMEDVEKGSTFSDELNMRRNGKITDELWDLCMALHSALCSTLNDGEMDASQAEESMQESIRQFVGVMAGSVPEWCAGRAAGIIKKNAGDIPPEELESMVSVRNRLTEEIEKASEKPVEIETEKGESEEMKINKSKLTPAELAFLEDIEKRCGEEETGGDASGAGEGEAGGSREAPAENGTESNIGKSAHQGNAVPAAQEVFVLAGQKPEADGDGSNIYKGLHPAVQAELQELKKFKEEAEDRELGLIADKYAIIGKKKEELVQTFKSLRTAGGTAFDDMIAVLDNAVDVVEKSGAFAEIGKSGGHSVGNAAEAKISDIAKGYMEKDPAMTYQAAMAKAWENNPEIMAEYEEQEGF